MIVLDRVSVRYQDWAAPVLDEVSLRIGEGELMLVTGPTGSGKSTLLGLLNGLVPHFTGGTVVGTVEVDGLRTDRFTPRDFAASVGVVGQDPLAGFVTDTVEEELAYGMEQLGVAPAVMRQRVEQTLDVLGIAELRARSLRTLSGGQQQRVAIGAVLAAGPRVLVLDEPTSALDPTSAEDVIAAVVRLVHDLGVTVVLSEHRLERVLQYADRVLLLDGRGGVVAGAPAEVMAAAPIAPPVVELGRLAGWQPLPLSVRDARRAAVDLRRTLPPPDPAVLTTRREVLVGQRVCVNHGGVSAVHEVSVRLGAGDRAVLMGRNGSGKSSLLWALSGAGTRTRGDVTVDGDTTRAGRTDLVGMVPQSPADLLYLSTVADECAAADRRSGRAAGTCRALLDRLVPGVPDDRHPRDLSEGQRLGLVLAAQLGGSPRVLLLDEPTRGLDYPAKARLTAALAELADTGIALLVATHDVEFAAGFAERVLLMAQGELIADGPVAELLCGSPALAPQVARVLHPLPYLTVDDVRPLVAAAGG